MEEPQSSPDFFSASAPEHDSLEVPEGVTGESIDFILGELKNALAAIELGDILAEPLNIDSLNTLDDLKRATRELKDRIQAKRIDDARKEAILLFIDAFTDRLIRVREAVEEREA